MSVEATTIANFAPWGNAQLTFTVGTGLTTTDAVTGNKKQSSLELDYLAHIKLSRPDYKSERGIDTTTYSCEGRLLSPIKLDSRITNGSLAVAVINGYQGRFELKYDLSMVQELYSEIRQTIQGTFYVTGGAG